MREHKEYGCIWLIKNLVLIDWLIDWLKSHAFSEMQVDQIIFNCCGKESFSDSKGNTVPKRETKFPVEMNTRGSHNFYSFSLLVNTIG